MKAELTKTYRFDAAHRLPNVGADHKCARPHGHGYRVAVTVAGEVDPQTGWVMDFGRINRAVGPLIEQLDHAELNAVDGLANPTTEMIAKWFWDRLGPHLPELAAVAVAESDTSLCTYRGA